MESQSDSSNRFVSSWCNSVVHQTFCPSLKIQYRVEILQLFTEMIHNCVLFFYKNNIYFQSCINLNNATSSSAYQQQNSLHQTTHVQLQEHTQAILNWMTMKIMLLNSIEWRMNDAQDLTQLSKLKVISCLNIVFVVTLGKTTFYLQIHNSSWHCK